jgi:succinate dehydrogenase / fumarate reductase cytochrome b subunit
MSWFWQSVNSSIGKKVLMAITGILLIGFITMHLLGNLTLYISANAFTSYAGALKMIRPIIRVIEVILASIFILHIINAIRVWWGNKVAKSKNYAVNAKSKNSTIFSRTMIQSGSIVFIFLVIHLQTIWFPSNFGGNENLYGLVSGLFTNPVYSWFYIFAMVLLGFHLNHGFQSAFQTLGLNHKKYFPLIQAIGTIYSILTAAGFASLPIYFLYFQVR